MENQLITFETAKLAKEKGFPIKLPKNEGYILEGNKPTQSLLKRWLREKHNIIVESTVYTYKLYTYKIYKYSEGIVKFVKIGGYEEAGSSYENVLEEGLKFALTQIK